MLNIITNGYILPFLSKPNLVRFPLILSEYKAHQRPSPGHLYPVSSVKERNRKGGKCKISRVLQSPVPSTQASPRWRPVIDLSRLDTFLHVEKFKMETPESIRTSLIPGEWASSIDLSDAYLLIPIHPNSRKYLRFCLRSQVFQFTSLHFGLATAPQVFTMIVKEVKLMALSRGLRLHQYLDDWRIRSQSQEEAQVNTQAVVDLIQSLGWMINQEKSELKPTRVFLCQLTCQSAGIMSSLCGVGVRVRVNNFSSKTTRPRDVLFFLKDTLSIEDEKLFKACKSVCLLETLQGGYPHQKCENFNFLSIFSVTIAGISLISCIYVLGQR